MWTLDTQIEVTPAGRAALDAIRERTTRRPMLFCGICDEPLREAFDSETSEEFCLCETCTEEPEAPRHLLTEPTAEEKASFYREDEEARNFSDMRGDC